jgi:hypothetical protein
MMEVAKALVHEVCQGMFRHTVLVPGGPIRQGGAITHGVRDKVEVACEYEGATSTHSAQDREQHPQEVPTLVYPSVGPIGVDQ